MKERPISEFEFLSKFSTEKKAVKFFEAARWPQGRHCPTCGSTDTYKHKSREFYYHCRDCRKQFSCKTNSIMQSSPIPVRTWLYAMYKVSVARKDISSLQMAKEIGVTQKSAWFMLQRIKEVCGNHGVILSGIVEIDETYIGGKEKNRHTTKKVEAGPGGMGKQTTIDMRERGGRTKAKPIANTSMATMHREIDGTVEFGSTVYTDEHRSYDCLHTDYAHGKTKPRVGEYVPRYGAHKQHREHMAGIEARNLRHLSSFQPKTPIPLCERVRFSVE